MRVAIVSNVAAPYRSELFAHAWPALGSLKVYIQAIHEPDRSWEARPPLPFPHVYLSGRALPLARRAVPFHPEIPTHLSAQRPDAIISYGFGTITIQCALYAAKARIPLLIANDGTPFTDPCRGLEFQYRRVLARAARGFIAASGSAAEYFYRLGAPANAVTIVELTRDLLAAREAARRSREAIRHIGRSGSNVRTVCIVARLVPDKRVLDGIRAFVMATEGDSQAQLIIAGDGPNYEDIASSARSLGGGRVKLVGLLQWDELLRLYAMSTVLLFPAVREKFGMVVIEALACGVPVVSYDRPGAARDLIIEGKTGFLVPEGDVSGMARQLKAIMRDRDLHSRMSANAELVTERHDIRLEAERFVAAVHRVCPPASHRSVA